MPKSPNAAFGRRLLGHEVLEGRSLLAGIVDDALASAWQNPLDCNDLNGDGSVTAVDALVAINVINSGGAGDLAAKAPPMLDGFVAGSVTEFLDASGDGHLSAADALAVINAINNGLPGGPIRNLPLDDQQGDTTTAAPTLEFGRGFARVLAAINTPGDVDVFKIVPLKSNINVALFSAGRVPLTVSVVEVDTSADGGIATLATATTPADSRRPAKLNLDVEVGSTYFVTVKGAAAETTGIYGLGVLNYSDEQFPPIIDSELGDDQHGGTATSATALPLRNEINAHVRSNIDAEGDVDAFEIDVTDGKLIVHASARFKLTLEVVRLDESGAEVAGSKVTADRRIISTVTAGTYVVYVKAADGDDTGAYALNVVNAPLPRNVPPDRDAAIEALFARLDANNDDALTPQEARGALPIPALPFLERIFNDWDSDDNGQLDFAEFEAGLDELHRRAIVHQPVREFLRRVRR